jgi:hypothetical protein
MQLFCLIPATANHARQIVTPPPLTAIRAGTPDFAVLLRIAVARAASEQEDEPARIEYC